MEKEIILEKIEQAKQILLEKNIDVWLTFVRESSVSKDPCLDMIVGTGCTWQSAFLIHKDGDTTAIVGSLEVPKFELFGTYKNVVGYKQSVKEPLLEYFNKFKPEKIAVNFSVNSNLADGLTYGMYLILADILKATPYMQRLISSEEIIASLRGRKSKSEIDLMKKAIDVTEQIFDDVTGFIQPGKTELEIAAFMKERIKQHGLVPSWDEEYCPSVFTGPDTAGAHSGPTDRKVEKGHVLNIDFGVIYNGYCSDMQRTWYILDESGIVPEEVKHGFEVLKTSMRKAAAALKPGKQGCEIDDITRSYIVENGYEEYQHGLGHQVGRIVHDGGGGFYPRWERYGNLPFLPLEEGQVYTIEPRLPVKGRGVVTMEEMIQITKDGFEYLSHPQEELIVIKT